MSRSQLKNNEIKFYTSNVGGDVTKMKFLPTTNNLKLEGASQGTAVTLDGIADPTNNLHGANKKYVDEQINNKLQGIRWKEPVVARTTANLTSSYSGNQITMTASGGLTLDGITMALNDRVLVANQTTQSQNGIYTITTLGIARDNTQTVLSRANDGDTAVELQSAALFIEKGSTYANSAFIQTTDDVTLNTSNLVWEQFASFSDLLGGDGISKTGNTFSIDVDNSTVELSAQKVAVKSLGIGHDQLALDAVQGENIVEGTITKRELGADSVERTEIKDGEVIESKLATDAVTSSKIKDGEVKEDELATDAVTTIKIKDLNVTTGKLELLHIT